LKVHSHPYKLSFLLGVQNSLPLVTLSANHLLFSYLAWNTSLTKPVLKRVIPWTSASYRIDHSLLTLLSGHPSLKRDSSCSKSAWPPSWRGEWYRWLTEVSVCRLVR